MPIAKDTRQLLKQVDEEYKEGFVVSVLSNKAGLFAVLALIFAIILEFFIARITGDWTTYEAQPIIYVFMPLCAFLLFYGAVNKQKSVVRLNYYMITSNSRSKGSFQEFKVWVSFLLHRKVGVEDHLLETFVLMKAERPQNKLVDLFDNSPEIFSKEAIKKFRK